MIRASQFVCRVATNTEEANALVKVGFTYVYTRLENMRLFRKSVQKSEIQQIGINLTAVEISPANPPLFCFDS